MDMILVILLLLRLEVLNARPCMVWLGCVDLPVPLATVDQWCALYVITEATADHQRRRGRGEGKDAAGGGREWGLLRLPIQV